MQHITCDVELSAPVKGQKIINTVRELVDIPEIQLLPNGYSLVGARAINGFYGLKILVDGADWVSHDYSYDKVTLVHWNWPGDLEFRDHLTLQKTAYLVEMSRKFAQELNK